MKLSQSRESLKYWAQTAECKKEKAHQNLKKKIIENSDGGTVFFQP